MNHQNTINFTSKRHSISIRKKIPRLSRLTSKNCPVRFQMYPFHQNPHQNLSPKHPLQTSPLLNDRKEHVVGLFKAFFKSSKAQGGSACYQILLADDQVLKVPIALPLSSSMFCDGACGAATS